MTLRVIILFLIAFVTFINGQTTYESWKLYDDSEVGTIEITVDPADLEWMYLNVQSDSIHKASIHFKNKWIDETVDSVGFRLRGNTSRNSQKKSFKVSFNSFIQGRKFFNVEKLNLNGEHNDPSIVRSKICWDLYETIGMPASRAAHFAVYINNEYYGLYISIEHIDEEFLQKNYADDSGNLWKCIWPADLTYRGANPENYFPYSGPDAPYELKTNEDEYDYSQLAKLISIINLTATQDLADSLETILAVPEFLKYLAMNTLVGSWDDYRSLMNNFYIYYEPKKDIFHWIPYDYDNTFGIDWFSVDWANAEIFNYPKVADGYRPLAERVMENSQYRNLYSHFLEFLNSNVVNNSELDGSIDSLHTIITPFAEDDYYRTLDYGFSIDQFHSSFSSVGFDTIHVKRGLKEFIKIRNESLPGMISYHNAEPIVYKFNYNPQFPTADDTIYVYASAFSHAGIENVRVLFHPGDLTVVESYPMTFSPVQGTKIVEEADLWIGKIPPLGEDGYGKFQIQIDDVNSNSNLYPRNKLVYISAPSVTNNEIIINELLALNDSTNSDASGEFDDWLELFNQTSETIDLSGMYLTDDNTNLAKWQFPEGYSIQPGKHLIVWCDNDEEQIGLHTNFKLSGGGEFVALTERDGITAVDSITFPEQSADISYGRYPDAGSEWTFMQPTPGSKNEPIVDVKDEKLILDFKLFQNYPNPFNPTTVIKYSVPQQTTQRVASTNVTLIVYDILGREVATLVNKEQKGGNYEVIFNSKNLSSGLYFYHLQSGSFIESKKMILLK